MKFRYNLGAQFVTMYRQARHGFCGIIVQKETTLVISCLLLWKMVACLTLKAPVTTTADDFHKYFFFSEKIRLDISCESSVYQSLIFFEK